MGHYKQRTDERDGLQSIRAKNEKHLNTLDRELDEAIEYGETLDKNIRNLETDVSSLSAAKKKSKTNKLLKRRKSRTRRTSPLPNSTTNSMPKKPKIQKSYCSSKSLCWRSHKCSYCLQRHSRICNVNH